MPDKQDDIQDDSQQWYPEVEQEQQDRIDEAERKLVGSLPVIQDVLDWFDEQIAIYKNPLTIEGISPSTPAEDVKSAVLLAQSLITDYKRQRQDFEATFSQYLKKEDEV